MKTICAVVAVTLILGFTAVNLFIPYALAVILAAAALAALFGVPCGLQGEGPSSECRIGRC